MTQLDIPHIVDIFAILMTTIFIYKNQRQLKLINTLQNIQNFLN